MVYIPQSQIKENQFTKKYSWVYLKNKQPYTGFYYTLSNGTAYTGKNPNNPPNDEIVQLSEDEISSPLAREEGVYNLQSEYVGAYEGNTFENQRQNALDVSIYGILNNQVPTLIRSYPLLTKPNPTPEDYEKGEFLRYFCFKINQPNSFLEINQETYDYLQAQNPVWMWEDFVSFTLNWYISGDIDKIFNNNKGSIFVKEQELKRKGLESYLDKQYLQLYHYPVANNLTTSGNELIYPNGVDYVGSYHINMIQGPMEGPIHTAKGHQKLFYKRFYIGQTVNVLNQTGVVETGETQNVGYRSSISPSTGGGY
jgi:hypothetical protein|tara:strand:+ start:2407 stop:3339 length:933 start_codon:yes stop_codon:yes gene_type:complete